jgi:hypothetical protein
MIRIVAVAAMMLVASSAVAQELVALFDIGNRQGRDLPVVVVRLVLPNNIIVNQLLVRRCDTDSLLPFFIEPIKPANDSLACWVRINNLPRSASIRQRDDHRGLHARYQGRMRSLCLLWIERQP